jgi:hypothetical protein
MNKQKNGKIGGGLSGAEMGRSPSLPNVKAQRWTWLARDVRLGAQAVTDMDIRYSAWLGLVVRIPIFRDVVLFCNFYCFRYILLSINFLAHELIEQLERKWIYHGRHEWFLLHLAEDTRRGWKMRDYDLEFLAGLSKSERARFDKWSQRAGPNRFFLPYAR